MRSIAEMTYEEREYQMRMCSLLLKDEGIGLRIMIALQVSEILQEIGVYESWRAFSALTNREEG